MSVLINPITAKIDILEKIANSGKVSDEEKAVLDNFIDASKEVVSENEPYTELFLTGLNQVCHLFESAVERSSR